LPVSPTTKSEKVSFHAPSARRSIPSGELAAHLLPVGMTIDPRKVAELASIAVAFEMPDEE